MMKKAMMVLVAVLVAVGAFVGTRHLLGHATEGSQATREGQTVTSEPSRSQSIKKNPVSQKDQPAQTSEVEERDLNVQRGSNTIVGKLLAPKGYERYKLPLVILSHGFGNTYDFIEPYAQKLAQQGFLVYIFDFVGGSHNSRSGGSMTDMSVFTEQEDLTAVLKQLRKESYVDESRVFLAGYSQGGVVSALTAADNPDLVKGLITLNGAYVLFNDARTLFATKADIPETYNHRGTILGRTYFENLLDFDLPAHLKKYKGPALIIQGNEDDIVPMSEAEAARDALSQSSLVELDGAGHILNEEEADQAVGAAVGFLIENSRD